MTDEQQENYYDGTDLADGLDYFHITISQAKEYISAEDLTLTGDYDASTMA